MRNICLYFSILVFSSCAMMETFNAPGALDTDEFIQGLELLRDNRKEEALLKFEVACRGHVVGACLYLGKDIDHSKLSPLSIMQGMTGKTETILSLAFETEQNVIYEIYDETSGSIVQIDQINVKEHSWPSHPERLLSLKLSGLVSDHDYRLEIYNGDHKLKDVRWFSTLNPNPKSFNYIVASCMDDRLSKKQKNMWDGVYQLRPEALFLIGDNAYTDTQMDRSKKITPGHMWSRFMDHRKGLGLYYFRKLIPVFALWDDHDYGMNNGNKTFELRAESTKLFQSFFPYFNIKEAQAGFGVGYKLTLADSNYYFLDGRSFRDISDTVTHKDGTHLGTDQEKWLYKNLNTDRKHSFLIKGDQFFGGYHPFESFEVDHPKSFNKFLRNTSKSKSPVAFISGDRHLSEIMEIKKPDFSYNTYEFTSSGIHSRVYPGSFKSTPNKRMLVGIDGAVNFTYLRSELKGKKLLLDVTSFGLDRIVHYSKRIEFKK